MATAVDDTALTSVLSGLVLTMDREIGELIRSYQAIDGANGRGPSHDTVHWGGYMREY